MLEDIIKLDDNSMNDEAYEMAKMLSPVNSTVDLTENSYEIESILSYKETIRNANPSKVYF